MRDLISLPEVASMLGTSRQRAWKIYKDGKLQAVMITGTDKRPRPLFSRTTVEAYKARKVAA